MDFYSLKQTITPWLHEAGTIINSRRQKGYHSTLKQDATPVTEIDQEVEKFLRQQINMHFPHHGIIGEEYGKTESSSEYTWLIDPIDGTRALMAGFPTFTILLALSRNHSPYFGAIYQPITGELWIGQAAQKSEHNGTTIQTRQTESLQKAFFSTTSLLLFSPAQRLVVEKIIAECKACQFGGDAYGYAQIASGNIDLIIEAGLKPYDFMALVPVIEGAGGKITDWSGAPLHLESAGMVCAAGDERIHRQALEVLATLTG